MAKVEEVKVPDIGDFEGVEVIEVLVKAGDTVAAEDPLISLESDKATMEVPAPAGGKVKEIKIKEGDKVSEGDLILLLEGAGEKGGNETAQEEKAVTPESEGETASSSGDSGGDAAREEKPAPSERPGAGSSEVRVPDIGDFEGVEVIEVLVKKGDTVAAEDPLISLESDKATMEVPAPAAGQVKEVKVKEGDKVSEGDLILILEGASGDEQTSATEESSAPKAEQEEKAGDERKDAEQGQRGAAAATERNDARGAFRPPPGAQLSGVDEEGFLKAHASPSVRRFARQLGVDLSQIEGSGQKSRILQSDVEQFVKNVMQRGGAEAASAAAGGGLPRMPQIDFSQFGEVEVKDLPRIRRLSAQYVHRSWVVVPHVTQHDQADITELEAFRKEENKHLDVKLTLLPFLIKASAAAIEKYPEFASSLDPDGEKLIMKHYTHIGVAVDTPNGLLVPVIRDADKKSIRDLAAEARELAKKARDGKIKREEMQGGVFSISSLGGIGGTAFTPIVNAPEVAILGVVPATMQPVWRDEAFVPRLMLPLSLSYDHRVIDGAKAARFARHLCQLLSDIRRLLL